MSTTSPVAVSITPSRLEVELHPPARMLSPQHLGMLWHNPNPRPRIRVEVENFGTHDLHVELSIHSGSPLWKPSWFDWVLAPLSATQLQGGDAIKAQDSLSGRMSATVFVRSPRDENRSTREIWLDVDIPADGVTTAGLIPFEIQAYVRESDYTIRACSEIALVRPESDLLDQLPSLYREKMNEIRKNSDPLSEPPFFERYLLGFDDVFRSLRETLNSMDQLFGPFSTPPNTLLWLGTWLLAPFDENWPEIKRRRLVKDAVEIYRWRGTKRGLMQYLEIYTGVIATVDDQPIRGMRLGPESKLGTPSTKLGDIAPHCFVVTLAVDDPNSIHEKTVRDIIDYVKPAHTGYSLRILKRAQITKEVSYVN